MTADPPLPDELRGGYHRTDPTDATLGAAAAVLYHDWGRNIRRGTVRSVASTGAGPRVELAESSTRVADRLVVEPAADDGDGAAVGRSESDESDTTAADDGDETVHRVLVETPFRTRTLGVFLALYVRDAD